MIPFILSMKRLMKSRSFIFTLIILPVTMICVAVGFRFSSESASSAGIFVENPNEYCFVSDFIENNPDIIPVASRDELSEKVSKGEFDCGFVIRSGIEEQLVKGSLKECVEVIVTERSTTAPIYTQKLTTDMLNTLVPYICTKQLVKNTDTGMTYDKMFSVVEEKYKKSLEEEGFEFVYREIDGKAAVKAENTLYPAIFKGIAAIVLFAFAMLATELVSQNELDGLFERLTAAKAMKSVILPFSAAYMLCGFAVSAVGIIAAEKIFPTGESVIREIIFVAVYLLALVGISLLLSCIKNSSSPVVAVLPLMLTAALVVCPVFIDLRSSYPFMNYFFAIFPPCWFFGYFENTIFFAVISLIVFTAGISAVFFRAVKKA